MLGQISRSLEEVAIRDDVCETSEGLWGLVNQIKCSERVEIGVERLVHGHAFLAPHFSSSVGLKSD